MEAQRWGGRFMENKDSEEERREAMRPVRKTCCLQRAFIRVYGTLDDKRHGVMVLSALRR